MKVKEAKHVKLDDLPVGTVFRYHHSCVDAELCIKVYDENGRDGTKRKVLRLKLMGKPNWQCYEWYGDDRYIEVVKGTLTVS